METPKKNPFTKRDFNLTQQGLIFKEDPKLFEKLKAKVQFINRGGEIIAY
jgi:hypothetical protein